MFHDAFVTVNVSERWKLKCNLFINQNIYIYIITPKSKRQSVSPTIGRKSDRFRCTCCCSHRNREPPEREGSSGCPGWLRFATIGRTAGRMRTALGRGMRSCWAAPNDLRTKYRNILIYGPLIMEIIYLPNFPTHQIRPAPILDALFRRQIRQIHADESK